MLIPFTKLNGGTLFVRAEDVRRIEDTDTTYDDKGEGKPCAVLYWVQEGDIRSTHLAGTAREVFDGIVAEERQRAQAHQELERVRQAVQQQFIPRGRVR